MAMARPSTGHQEASALSIVIGAGAGRGTDLAPLVPGLRAITRDAMAVRDGCTSSALPYHKGRKVGSVGTPMASKVVEARIVRAERPIQCGRMDKIVRRIKPKRRHHHAPCYLLYIPTLRLVCTGCTY